jgi:Family of unknown function (DUF6328)
MANLNSLLKISLDELRMQMLGTQVAFGFQFQSLFQDRFDVSDAAIRVAALSGLAFIVLTLALSLAAPAAHRIAYGGLASERTRQLASALARAALVALSIGLSAVVFVTVATEFGHRSGAVAGTLVVLLSVVAWQGWGMFLRSAVRRSPADEVMNGRRDTTLHDRIDYVLTEARVMLPGAQALLAFQLLVPLTRSFETLPEAARLVHFAALALVAIAVMLLIAPAAVHRIAFDGADDERFVRLASHMVTAALIPLALGLASELYVAAVRLLPASSAAGWIAAGSACVLLGFWYVLPLVLRVRSTRDS